MKRFFIVLVWRGFRWELKARAKHPLDLIAGLAADTGADASIRISIA